LCVLVPVKFSNEIRILRGAIFLCVWMRCHPCANQPP
jgi:hypothetical protein